MYIQHEGDILRVVHVSNLNQSSALLTALVWGKATTNNQQIPIYNDVTASDI